MYDIYDLLLYDAPRAWVSSVKWLIDWIQYAAAKDKKYRDEFGKGVDIPLSRRYLNLVDSEPSYLLLHSFLPPTPLPASILSAVAT